MMDVAAKAGVSQATVSLVLSGGKGRLAEDTRRRVLAAAQELRYKFVRRGPRTTPGAQSMIIFVADEIIQIHIDDELGGRIA